MKEPHRSRPVYAGAALLTVGLGLATRPLKHVWDAGGSALGDALWAVLVYLLLGIAFPRLCAWRVAIAATLVAWAVEFSQLWHPAWLNTLRRTTFGALAIGGTFSVGDLCCYTVGTMTIYIVERITAGVKRHRI